MRSSHLATARLRETVNAYRAEHTDSLDKWALALLDRLVDSKDAAEAFAGLKLRDADQEGRFLTLCVLVEQLARRFPSIVVSEQRLPVRLAKLDKAVSDLRSFVFESAFVPPASDLLTDTRFTTTKFAVRRLTMLDGLKSIAELIEDRRKEVGHTAIKLGATRDRHSANAAIIVAIRHLVVGVRALTGKAHHNEIGQLAPLIMGQELPDKSVTYAVRTPPTKFLVRYVERLMELLGDDCFLGDGEH
jgi:hypothetical protein